MQRDSESQCKTLVPFDVLQDTCKEFSLEWETGDQPDLPSYVLKVAKDDQPTLLRNLLDYEISKRRELGESPKVENYLRLLPGHSEIVMQVFQEWDASREHKTLSTTKELRHNFVPASRLGEFRLIKEIGRGGMGVVYEAVHATKGYRVALKALPKVSPDALHRFKREFRSVSEVNHPNLVGLHSLESDGGQFFITMDLIVGVDFLSWVRPGGHFNEGRMRQALPQLVSAIVALHGRDIVHRDLKPSNVKVTLDGHLIVLDFGLVVDLAGTNSSLAELAGTPEYMAPEQKLPEQKYPEQKLPEEGFEIAVAPSVDWYAVGVMLFEGFTGKLPFRSAKRWNALQLKNEHDAPPIADEHNIPDDLASLCQQLLSREPQDRPDPLSIAKLVEADLSDHSRRADTSEQLIGRENQLAQFADAKQCFEQTGEQLTVFISGKSGEGKTTIAERFIASFDQTSAVVLGGRCYDRESVPFKALDSFVGALVQHLLSMTSDVVTNMLPDDIGILAQVFPELNRSDVVASIPQDSLDGFDQQQVRARAFNAMRILLQRISQRSKLILFIDDLQWGDEDSAKALFEILRPEDAPRILFLGSYRSDEATDSPFLTEWHNLQRVNEVRLDERIVHLEAFTFEQSKQLMQCQQQLSDETVEQLANQFHDQTGGNPFLLTELLSCFNPQENSFDISDINDVLDQKLSPLPAEARPLLETISVSGQALDASEAVAAIGLSGSCDDTLIAMRKSRLLRLIGNKIDTYHDRIRYAIVDRLGSQHRQQLHVKLAQVIESLDGGLSDEEVQTISEEGSLDQPRLISRVYDLAYHWDASGNHTRALAYGLAAAAQASSQYAFDVAANQYALASRNASAASEITRYRISRGRGEVLMMIAHYDQAAQELDCALPLAPTPHDIADVIGLQGVLARSAGMIGKSIEHLEDAIGRVGVPVPRTFLGLGYETAKEVFVQAYHTALPRRLHRRPHSQSSDLCNWLLGQIEYCYYVNSVPRLIWASMVGLNRAEKVPESSSLALQYIVHANDMAVLGWHKRAERYYQAAADLSNRLNDRRLAAVTVSHHSLGNFAAADFKDGVTKARKAIIQLSRLGDAFEAHAAQIFLSLNLYHLGDLAAATKAAEEELQSCLRHEHHYMGSIAHSILMRSSRGQYPLERYANAFPDAPGHWVARITSLMAEGYWCQANEQTETSVAKFDEAWEICKTYQCLTTFNFSIAGDRATAIRHHAETLEAAGEDSREVRRKWRQAAKSANRLSWILAPQRPQALREMGLIYASTGRTKKALHYLSRSCIVAEKQNARYEYLVSKVLQRQLERDQGKSVPETEIGNLRQEIEAIHVSISDAVAISSQGFRTQ